MRIYFAENTIYMNVESGALVYKASAEDFVFEAGESAPVLPDRMVAMEYRPDDKVLVYYDDKQNAYPLEGQTERPELAALFERRVELRAAQQLREDHELALRMNQIFDDTPDSLHIGVVAHAAQPAEVI